MKKRTSRILWSFACIFLILGAIALASSAPGDFPEGATLSIPKGSTITDAANKLFDKGFIRSTALFKLYVSFLGNDTGVKTGNYFFGASESALRIAYRLVMGLGGVPQTKVTIPEGLASSDIARTIKRDIPAFDDKGFLKLARPLEGYLYPDTYFFDQFTAPGDAISALRINFNDHTAGIYSSKMIMNKVRTFKEILTMASLLEEEATSSADRRMIAGVLWKRLDIGMALQVDAPFFYIYGKVPSKLTAAEFATTSPYNLYKHAGLPPTPIDNPGVDAIVDAINPTPSKYLFFLSGTDGRTHFAETLEEHGRNIDKYLK